MTKAQFLKLAYDFADYARTEVSYKAWSPSANDFRTATGILLGLDLYGVNTECLVLGSMGRRVTIYYKYVDFPKKQTARKIGG